jgi:hypothetical protein
MINISIEDRSSHRDRKEIKVCGVGAYMKYFNLRRRFAGVADLHTPAPLKRGRGVCYTKYPVII